MAYATLNQLKSRLGLSVYTRLTDRVAGAVADDAAGQQILDEAEADVDSRLAARFATPVNLAVRPELANIFEARVLDVAEYIAWRSSPFVGDVPDRIRLVYDQALRWFDGLLRGAIDLPAAAPPASRAAGNDAPRFSATPRIFTADELDGL